MLIGENVIIFAARHNSVLLQLVKFKRVSDDKLSFAKLDDDLALIGVHTMYTAHAIHFSHGAFIKGIKCTRGEIPNALITQRLQAK